MILNDYRKIEQFDFITQYRLRTMLFWSICLFIISPLLLELKGEYLLTWAISIFMIAEQLALKTNRFMTERFSLSELYKMGIYVHLVFLCSSLIYFYDKLYMVIADSILAIIDTTIFSALSIKLNNYLIENYPEKNNEFQIVRNSLWVDGVLIALSFSTIISYFLGRDYLIYVFIFINIIFNIYLFKNYNIYDKLIKN